MLNLLLILALWHDMGATTDMSDHSGMRFDVHPDEFRAKVSELAVPFEQRLRTFLVD